MKAIIKRELKNYLKNPLLWIGLIVVIAGIYSMLGPYLTIHYFSEQELAGMGDLSWEQMGDADIMQGVVKATKERQYEDAFSRIKKDLTEAYEMTEAEADQIIGFLKNSEMTEDEITDYMVERYDYRHADYHFDLTEYHRGTADEVNAYIAGKLAQRPYSAYFAEKFADFAGLFMGFFATVLLAFLFMRDTKKDTYELLHTKPVGALGYVAGKVCGGFLVMALVVGILNVIFGGLCLYHGAQAGLPVGVWDLPAASVKYILPNMLMIVSVYAVISLVFKNPLPAAPLLVLYMLYSNMGSIGPDGHYGYYGRFLAVMVRFPGQFFEISPPPMVFMNQMFLLLASAAMTAAAAVIWKRRRVY